VQWYEFVITVRGLEYARFRLPAEDARHVAGLLGLDWPPSILVKGGEIASVSLQECDPPPLHHRDDERPEPM